MSDPRLKELLADLLEQCQLLIEDTYGTSRSDFSSNRILQQSVERYLTIIGEIGATIRPEYPGIFDSLPELRYSVGLRNRLSHGYGKDIDENIIWQTITLSIPDMRASIDQLLTSGEPDQDTSG